MASKPGTVEKSAKSIASSRTCAPGRPSRKDCGDPSMGCHAKSSSREMPLISRSPTHKPHPDSCCGKFYERQVVGVVFFVARGDRPEMFELVEETLDEVAEA